jgi:hypothetical protein
MRGGGLDAATNAVCTQVVISGPFFKKIQSKDFINIKKKFFFR